MDREGSDELFDFDLEDALGFLFTNDNVKASDVVQGAPNSAGPEERRIELVTHKAGFDGVDQAKVNEILKKLEENSLFGRLKAKKDAELQENIREQRLIFERLQAQDLTFARSRVQLSINRIEQKRDLSKYIVCVDMDAYYASIEERDNPALASRPMGVGDSAMLCTANYTARKFGVRSGMPGYFAEALCPQIVIVKPNFEKYTDVSRRIRAIFARYDPEFSAMSLDEAFLDITNYAQDHNQTPEDVVQHMRDEICDETKLTASAGIAANKLLAKVCAEVNKPNGQFRLANDKNKILEFLRDLPVRKICGIGQVAAKILNGVLNIHTCGELLDKLVYINMMFSENSFSFYTRVALGIGSNGISTSHFRKTISTSRTFTPTNDVKLFYEYLRHVADELAQRLDQENLEGKTIAVVFKMQTFEQFTRQKALTKYISFQHDLYRYSKAILDKEVPISLRLLGIRITNIRDKSASNAISVKRYFANKEDDKGAKIDALSTPSTPPSSSAMQNRVTQNPDTKDNITIPNTNGENLSNGEEKQSNSNGQSLQQESSYLTSRFQKTRCELKPLTCQRQSGTAKCRDTGLQKLKMQYIPDVEQNSISSAQHTSLQDDDLSTESSLISDILEAKMRIPSDKTTIDVISNDSKVDNEQFQDEALSPSIMNDIVNVASTTELSKPFIPDDNLLIHTEENVKSKVDFSTRKRALDNFETLSLKRRLINGDQELTLAQAQVGDNQTWNCPICNRHFNNPTKMRINSHLEACRAPRFPNTKISGVKDHGRGRERGRKRGSQPVPQPTITLHDFFPSYHLKPNNRYV